MEYRELGRTGVQVSALCLGTMTWGEQNTREDAFEQLDTALEAGINFIDTAEMYPVPPRAQTQGVTESYLGDWLQARQCRQQLVIATKVAGPAAWLPYLRGGPRLNARHIEEALEASLTRLQTDYVDLYQLHWPERKTNYFGQLGYRPEDDGDAIPIEETLKALKRLVDSGKVRHIGLSNETAWGAMRFLAASASSELPRVVSIQNPYSLLNRSFEAGLSEVAMRENCGLLAYSPLAFGVLSGKYLGGKRPEGARLTLFDRFSRYTSEQAEQATAAYQRLASERGLSLSQMALAFVTSRPFVTSNIIGATTLEQLKENLDSIAVTIDPDLEKALEEVHRVYTYPCP